MAPAAHGHRQVILAGKGDGYHHIGSIKAAYNQGRMTIDCAIPDASRRCIVVVTGEQQLPPQAGRQCPRNLLIRSLSFALRRCFPYSLVYFDLS